MLTIENLETYYGPIMAIRGVSLTVPEGKIVAILGSNGAGKTTILKTISGAMDPQKGQITFLGHALGNIDPDQVARYGIAHVPEGREVFPFLSIEDNLLMGAFTRSDKQGIASDLNLIYQYFPILKQKKSGPACYLSGGQQQMLAIGRGLMMRPKLLLLDEPSLGLSPLLVNEIFSIIKKVNEEQGVTMLLVEQNAKMALQTASYGYVLEMGRIVLEDTCERLLQSEDIKEFYLGQKETSALQRKQRRWKKKKTWR